MCIVESVFPSARGGAPGELRNPGGSERSIWPRGRAAGGGRDEPLCNGSSDHEKRMGGATIGFFCGAASGLAGRGAGASGGPTPASGGRARVSSGLTGSGGKVSRRTDGANSMAGAEDVGASGAAGGGGG